MTDQKNEEPHLPIPLENIPATLKKSLIWPVDWKIKKATTTLTSSVTTSEQFSKYQKKIDYEIKKETLECTEENQ